MNHFSLTTLLCLLASLLAAPPTPASPRTILEHATVRVEGTRNRNDDTGYFLQWCGSGFMVKGGWLVTNFHVAGDGMLNPAEQSGGGTLAGARILCTAASGIIDLGIVKEDHELKDLTLFSTNATGGLSEARWFDDLLPGEPVYALGNRHCGGLAHAESQILELHAARGAGGTRNDDRRIESSTDILLDFEDATRQFEKLIFAGPRLAVPGCSGGPAVDQYGALIGVIFARSQQHTLIVPAEYLLAMAPGMRLHFTRRNARATTSETPFGLGDDTPLLLVNDTPPSFPPRTPGIAYPLIRHQPLKSPAQNKIKTIILRETDTATADAILSRTIDLRATPAIIGVPHTLIIGEQEIPITHWHKGPHPAENQPAAAAWFFTTIEHERHIFLTLPSGHATTGEYRIRRSDGTIIQTWPDDPS